MHSGKARGQHPITSYDKSALNQAGKTLGQIILPHQTKDAASAFRIVHDFRDAHKVPLLQMRMELSRKIRLHSIEGFTAGRIKRMRSVRLKLAPTTHGIFKLTQIQDIAGCRAVVSTIKDVQALSDSYKQGESAHRYKRQTDYIVQPKESGYRSIHTVLFFKGNASEEIFTDLQGELQIRTGLQHAWATANEAVGLRRNEDLKLGKGDEDWRRLFALMSSEFANLEQAPLVPSTSESAIERREEIQHLENKLDGIEALDAMNRALKISEMFGEIGTQHFLVNYDRERDEVTVRPFYNYETQTDEYRDTEMRDKNGNSVLVEVDKATDLRSAYPNYFLDVKVFVDHLRQVVKGQL